MKTLSPKDPLEYEIESALLPGQYIEESCEGAFVNRLDEIVAQVESLVKVEPARAERLYAVFLAGCMEKIDQVGGEGLVFGCFFNGLRS